MNRTRMTLLLVLILINLVLVVFVHLDVNRMQKLQQDIAMMRQAPHECGDTIQPGEVCVLKFVIRPNHEQSF
jgi:hypothetical protein